MANWGCAMPTLMPARAIVAPVLAIEPATSRAAPTLVSHLVCSARDTPLTALATPWPTRPMMLPMMLGRLPKRPPLGLLL